MIQIAPVGRDLLTPSGLASDNLDNNAKDAKDTKVDYLTFVSLASFALHKNTSRFSEALPKTEMSSLAQKLNYATRSFNLLTSRSRNCVNLYGQLFSEFASAEDLNTLMMAYISNVSLRL